MKVIWIALLLLPLAPAQTASTQPGQPASSNPPTPGQVDNGNVKPEDKCTVEGKILNSMTGEPLKKAHVTLRRMDSTTFNAPPYGAVTDAGGHFAIVNIDPGRYHLSVERTGYARSENTPRNLKSSPDTLTLAAAQKLADLQFKLVPQAVITGRVVDEDNEPLAGISVQCSRYSYMNGKKTLLPSTAASTNDKGEYRAYGLAAGKYYVAASMRQMSMMPEIRTETTPEEDYVPTYYPNSLDPGGAVQVNAVAGAETSGVDIRLLRAKTFQVAGKIMNALKPTAPVQINLSKHDSSGAGMYNWDRTKHTMSDPKGGFLFRGVMPGTYDVEAMEFGEDQTRVALAQVTVGDSSIDGLQVAFVANPDVPGVLKVENAPNQGQQSGSGGSAAGYHIYLQPESNIMNVGRSGGEVKDDGTFTLKNVLPMKYRVYVNPLQSDAYVKQISVGNEEAVDERVDFSAGADGKQITVVVSANGGHIEGNAQDDKQQPAPHATVVLVPDRTDATQRYKTGSTDQNGHYVLRGIAPGKYKLYALDHIDPGAYADPAYMETFQGKATSLEITEGAKVTQDLALIVNEDDGAAH